MKQVFEYVILVHVVLLVAVATPTYAQNYCDSSQSVAVKCYVRNAVDTGTVTLPAGMTLSQYQAYGVAVLRILQSGHTYFLVLGAATAISDAMPPTNSDGSPNQAAQDAAVNAIIDSALSNGLITLPSGVTEAQVQEFGRDTTDKMDTNDGASFSPGGVLRIIDSYIVSYTDSNGNVNWTSVSSALNTVVSNLIGTGMIKLTPAITSAQVSQFAVGVAQAIETYKTATNKKSL